MEGKEPELLSEVPESYSWAHLRAQPAFWKHCPGDGAGFCSSVRVRGRYTCVLPVRCTGVSPVEKKGCFPTPLAHGVGPGYHSLLSVKAKLSV